jgi:hypothetical protein
MALAFELGSLPLLIVSPPDHGGTIPDHTRLGQESFGPTGSDEIDS